MESFDENCRCTKSPFDYRDYEIEKVGVDETRGRFGDVTIETCKKCGRKWLNYLIEEEAFPKSGRWYRGLVSGELARTVTPENALRVIQALEWRFSGGSYFDSPGFKSCGPIADNL